MTDNNELKLPSEKRKEVLSFVKEAFCITGDVELVYKAIAFPAYIKGHDDRRGEIRIAFGDWNTRPEPDNNVVKPTHDTVPDGDKYRCVECGKTWPLKGNDPLELDKRKCTRPELDNNVVADAEAWMADNDYRILVELVSATPHITALISQVKSLKAERDKLKGTCMCMDCGKTIKTIEQSKHDKECKH